MRRALSAGAAMFGVLMDFLFGQPDFNPDEYHPVAQVWGLDVYVCENGCDPNGPRGIGANFYLIDSERHWCPMCGGHLKPVRSHRPVSS